MNKIKILQINKLYAPWVGGIETVVRNIAEGINDKTAMEVLVCQPKGKGKTEIYNNIKVTRAHSFGMFFSMPVSLDFIHKFRKKSKNADIILLHTPFPLGDLAMCLTGRKAKIAIWWHSDIVKQKFLLRLLKPLINNSLKKADIIFTATEGNIKGSPFLLKHSEKCITIPFGLDFKQYETVTIKNYLQSKINTENNLKLLFVGRLVYYKGIDTLIRSMKNVSGAELFVVGEGPQLQEMIGLTKSLSIEEKIHFLGMISFDELKAAFSDCDVFVFPSVEKSEAFGIVQLEAMFYGKPVINTNLPTGVPYVSIDGQTGITVNAGRVNELYEAIQTLVDDDEKRLLYGINAGNRVRDVFDINKMMNDLYMSIEKLNG